MIIIVTTPSDYPTFITINLGEAEIEKDNEESMNEGFTEGN